MNKFLPIQLKFNTYGLLKLSLLTLFVSLFLGSYTRANAESAPKDEVISIPPQEAYFVKDTTHATPGEYNSSSQYRDTLGHNAVSNNLKHGQDIAKKTNSVSGTQGYPTQSRH